MLDTSVVPTRLPTIQAEPGFSPARLSWVQSADALAFRGPRLVRARAGDVPGQRRMFVVGLAILTPASLAAAAAAPR